MRIVLNARIEEDLKIMRTYDTNLPGFKTTYFIPKQSKQDLEKNVRGVWNMSLKHSLHTPTWRSSTCVGVQRQNRSHCSLKNRIYLFHCSAD